MERRRRSPVAVQQEAKVDLPIEETPLENPTLDAEKEIVEESPTKSAKQPVPTGKIRWLKTAGAINLNGKVIKSGERFLATVDEIPLAFRDTCKPLDPLPANVPIEYAASIYSITSADVTGKYNITDANGKQINSKPLTIQEAEKIVAMMS